MVIQDDAAAYDAVFAGIGQNQLRLAGLDLIYGRLFDKIGFGAVRTSDDEIFKIIVVTRLYRPGSKLKTLRYMAYFMNKYYDEDKIYRYLDELCWRPGRRHKGNYDVNHDIEQVTYNHTEKVLGGIVAIVFYDTTTMYFESREDDVRIPGSVSYTHLENRMSLLLKESNDVLEREKQELKSKNSEYEEERVKLRKDVYKRQAR